MQIKPIDAAELSPPPIPNVKGYWIQRPYFQGRKSFGAFQCCFCGNAWTSAHAYANYGQGCRRCNIINLPMFLWQNQKAQKKNNLLQPPAGLKPHDRERCEACRAGVCTVDAEPTEHEKGIAELLDSLGIL